MTAVLGALVLAATAAAQSSAPAGGGRAVVLVRTPDLPTGSGPVARQRWHELRSASSGILGRVADRAGLRVQDAVPEIGMLSVDLGPGGLPALKRELAADPRVESVRPDPPVQLRYSPNDFAFTHTDVHAPNGDLTQWNLVREGGPRAWDLSRGTRAEVAMVDSGVDGTHPDLSGRIAGADAFGASSPTTDQIGHGTHTAGLACGDADNSFGIASMGFDCSLYIAKILFNGPCSNVSSAITAAANRNSDVISMSLGGCDSGLVPALSYAQGRGSILVSAADNNPISDRLVRAARVERLHLSGGVAAAQRQRPERRVRPWPGRDLGEVRRDSVLLRRGDESRLRGGVRIGIQLDRGAAGDLLQLARERRR